MSTTIERQEKVVKASETSGTKTVLINVTIPPRSRLKGGTGSRTTSSSSIQDEGELHGKVQEEACRDGRLPSRGISHPAFMDGKVCPIYWPAYRSSDANAKRQKDFRMVDKRYHMASTMTPTVPFPAYSFESSLCICVNSVS